MEALPFWLIVVLILAAIAAGLWVGGRAGHELEARKGDPAKPLGTRIRDAAGKGVVSIWRWNRGRKKEKARRDRELGRNDSGKNES